MKFFTMIRKGVIKPLEATSNQCKFEGFDHYIYCIKMAFPGSQHLDKDGFILDNSDVDLCICNLPLEGSCEQMHIKMLDAIQDLMKGKNVDMVAYKASIYPYSSLSGDISYIDFLWVSDLTWGADQGMLVTLVNT